MKTHIEPKCRNDAEKPNYSIPVSFRKKSGSSCQSNAQKCIIKIKWGHINTFFFSLSLSDNLNTTQVHLGVNNRTGSEPNREIRDLEDIICHPEYDAISLDSDICLLKLSTPVNFTDYIRPVCLAAEGSTFHDGITTWITGFGTTGKLQSIQICLWIPLQTPNLYNFSNQKWAWPTSCRRWMYP